MRGKWIAVLCIGFFLTIANYSTAQQAKEITCSGNVVNVAGEPIAGAQVGPNRGRAELQGLGGSDRRRQCGLGLGPDRSAPGGGRGDRDQPGG